MKKAATGLSCRGFTPPLLQTTRGAAVQSTESKPSIHYCKGHGWQLLTGVDLDLQVMRECSGCKVIDREATA